MTLGTSATKYLMTNLNACSEDESFFAVRTQDGIISNLSIFEDIKCTNLEGQQYKATCNTKSDFRMNIFYIFMN